MFDDTIINNIRISEKKINNDQDTVQLLSYLNRNYKFDNKKCLGNGGTCILAYNTDTYVMKVCIKNELMRDINKFISHAEKLKEIGVPIIKINEIVFENDSFLIYTQDFCKKIELNGKYLTEILKIAKRMIDSDYIVPDIFFTNFGIHKNTIGIFDYHDMTISDNWDMYMMQFAYMFSFVKFGTGFHNNDVNINKSVIVNARFGKNYLENDEAFLIEALSDHDIDMIRLLLNAIIDRMSYANQFSVVNYQELLVDKSNTLHLFSHTRSKYNFVVDNLDEILTQKNVSVIDFGCCIGGIGCRIAQTYPDASVTLNNITETELTYCRKLVDNLSLENVLIDTNNMTQIQNAYDVTLYFAILHHILKTHTMKWVISMILSHTKKYAIIELPFKNDALLDIVISNSSSKYDESYYFLESTDIFINEMTKYFKLITFKHISYGEASPDINRYVFLFETIESVVPESVQ